MSQHDKETPPTPLANALDTGEQLLWWARPTTLAFIMGGLLVTVPMGLVALISALWWSWGEHPAQIPVWAQLVLGLVLLFSAHMLLFRPMLSLHLARTTFYGITDRRAIVHCTAWGGRTYLLPHHQGNLFMLRGPKGFGTIQFGQTAHSSLDVILLGRAAIAGFYGLREVERIYDMLNNQRQRGSSGR